MNDLKMVCVIVNFAAVIHICWLDNINIDAYPVLMNGCDNTAACSWISHKFKTSLLGRAMGCLFVGLLMGTKIWYPS